MWIVDKRCAITIDEGSTECITSTAPNDIAVIACKYYYDDALTVVVGETTITITSTSEPDHKSMYYESSNPLFEEYSEPENEDFKKNPNPIRQELRRPAEGEHVMAGRANRDVDAPNVM